MKLIELIASVAAVVRLLKGEATTPPPPPPLSIVGVLVVDLALILRIPLELVQLIVLRCIILCTMPSLVPNGRNSTTSVWKAVKINSELDGKAAMSYKTMEARPSDWAIRRKFGFSRIAGKDWRHISCLCVYVCVWVRGLIEEQIIKNDGICSKKRADHFSLISSKRERERRLYWKENLPESSHPLEKSPSNA